MTKNTGIWIVAAAVALLEGCACKQGVLFATVTNTGIDVDTSPPNAAIGYNRYEGYCGPVYATGGLPPVVAKLESDLNAFDPTIKQIYATGDAARVVSSPKNSADHSPEGSAEEKPLTGARSIAFFTTSAVVGLRVAFNPQGPESLSLGFKRKEASYIPVIRAEAPGEKDKYASTLASIGVNVATPSLSDTGLGVSQFFATGVAAEGLARNKLIREEFDNIAQKAVAPARFQHDAYSKKLRQCSSADPCMTKLKAWAARNPNNNCRRVQVLTSTDKCAADREKAVADLGL